MKNPCDIKPSAPAACRCKIRMRPLAPVCWVIVPAITVSLLILDAVGIYTFNTERLIVLGIGLVVILLPFFREITVKGVSVKRDPSDGGE